MVLASLVDHAKKELEKASLFDKDSDYDGMIGKAVLELLEVFSKQGHSGMSAAMVRDLFNKLSDFKTLTPITSKTDEWHDVSESIGRSCWHRQETQLYSQKTLEKHGTPYENPKIDRLSCRLED